MVLVRIRNADTGFVGGSLAIFESAAGRFGAAVQHLDLWSISFIARFARFASLLASSSHSVQRRTHAAQNAVDAAPVQLAVPNATAAIKKNATKKKDRRRGRALRRPRGLRLEDGDGAARARAYIVAGW